MRRHLLGPLHVTGVVWFRVELLATTVFFFLLLNAKRALARDLGAEVAWAIGQKPHQWFCFGPLWPD